MYCQVRYWASVKAHQTPGREDAVQYGNSRHKAKSDVTMNTYTYLDPSSLILRFAPRMALGIKLLYNFAN